MTAPIINLFGAPGSGKSTTRAGVFHKLKLMGKNVEEVTEYAKDLTWEKRHYTLTFQPYIFAKQWRNTERLVNQVSMIVTDSPLLLSVFYAAHYRANLPESFYQLVKDAANSYKQINFLLGRTKKYNPAGRNQTESESNAIGKDLKKLLDELQIVYEEVPGNDQSVDYIVQKALEKYPI